SDGSGRDILGSREARRRILDLALLFLARVRLRRRSRPNRPGRHRTAAGTAEGRRRTPRRTSEVGAGAVGDGLSSQRNRSAGQGGSRGEGRVARSGEPLPGGHYDVARGARLLRQRDRRGRAPLRRGVSIPHRAGAAHALGNAVRRFAVVLLVVALYACKGEKAKETDAQTDPTPEAPTPVKIAS